MIARRTELFIAGDHMGGGMYQWKCPATACGGIGRHKVGSLKVHRMQYKCSCGGDIRVLLDPMPRECSDCAFWVIDPRYDRYSCQHRWAARQKDKVIGFSGEAAGPLGKAARCGAFEDFKPRILPGFPRTLRLLDSE